MKRFIKVFGMTVVALLISASNAQTTEAVSPPAATETLSKEELA